MQTDYLKSYLGIIFFLNKKTQTTKNIQKQRTTLGSTVMRHFSVFSIHNVLSKSAKAEHRCNTI